MARKRVISLHNNTDEVMKSKQAGHSEESKLKEYPSDPIERHAETGWREWFKNEFLRYWYIIGCLFVDSMIFLQVALAPDRPLILALAIVIALLIAEMFVYVRIWGKKGDED